MPRVLIVLLLAATTQADWGRDINAGMGPQMLRSVETDLVAIVKAKPAVRDQPIEACVAAHGFERIEALKRYRNPELLAYGQYEIPAIPLYRVQFNQTEVWPEYEGPASDTMVVDIYENWLEPAEGDSA